MLAKMAEHLPDEEAYIFEYKWDGYRCITTIVDSKANLYSRNGLLFNKKFPGLLKELQGVIDQVVIDGEIIALKNNKPDFQFLQNAGKENVALRYYLFDLLYLNGTTITGLPFNQRNELLSLFYKKYKFKNIFISESLSGNTEKLMKDAARKGLEGIIAKRRDGIYLPGKRTSAWLKLKVFNTQSAIICGFTKPQGSRSKFGALILSIYDKGTYKYIGHCGTGFTEDNLFDLHKRMKPLITSKCPFPSPPATNQPAVWLKPKLICDVKFTEWTADGSLRHPVFRGLRDDIQIKNIIREPVNPEKMATSDKKNHAKDNRSKPDPVMEIKGINVPVSNLDKIYWPGEKYTKGDLLHYYAEAAPYLFPYLKDRPMSLHRYPNGIGKPSFYQKDVEVKQLPEWVHTESIYSESTGKNIDYIVCKNEATILYMANLGCIELNPWNSRTGNLDDPDYLVIDLDPGEIEFKYVVQTALATKSVCDELKISCYCKTSGATGLHIYIPLHAKYNYGQVRQSGELLAHNIHERTASFTSIERALSKRKNKVYIDYLQNSRGQTLASVFSVRPKPRATVSTPLDWDEVNLKLDPKKYTLFNTLKSIGMRNNMFLPVLSGHNNLNNILKLRE